MITEITVTDTIQNRLDWSKYTLTIDIVLLAAVGGAYMYLPWDTITLLLKVYIVFLFVRYLVSELTLFRKASENKKHFQISGHFGLFLLIVLFLRSVLQLNNYAYNLLIVSFGLLNVATHAHTTMDILFTYLVVNWLYSSLCFIVSFKAGTPM
uniref:Sphingomyelin synthase-like domain-containing protein n=1 Tax=viral metagenome TaxID=1070528 RepID=A0A6C0H6K6_9ZZZZ